MRVTRLAKKRAMETLNGSQFQPANKKRVVLGEISNNTVPIENPVVKCGSKKVKAVKPVTINKSEIEKIEEDEGETYVSDIFDYLHNMEVIYSIELVLC